jgi:contractile injection system tube protein/LysM domain-containing protein
MTLAKAEIRRESPPGARPISVLFNPGRYSLDASNQIAEIGVPGLPAPLLQFVRGGSRTLTMQLFFDTYEERSDVRVHTDAVYGLLDIEPTTHAPPICEFRWGRVMFRSVVERVGGQFTMFLADGTPVRATLDVTFRQYVDARSALRARPTQSADHATSHVVARGETLSAIAALHYDDPRRWRPIADANRLANPRKLVPGQILSIPALR